MEPRNQKPTTENQQPKTKKLFIFSSTLGVNSVKFTGEVLKTVKMATYEINIKRILKKEGTAVGLANGILSADGKIIYKAENLKVGLFKSWEE